MKKNINILKNFVEENKFKIIWMIEFIWCVILSPLIILTIIIFKLCDLIVWMIKIIKIKGEKK